MRTIYKEEYRRKKLPTVIGVFFFLTFIILLYDLLSMAVESNKIASIASNVFLCIVILAAIVVAIKRCSYGFKCSLISDQFIIHKMLKKEQYIEQNIKAKDIICIKEVNTFGFLLKRISCESYLSSAFTGKIYCCVYKEGERIRRFFFQPSSTLITKINDTMKDECKHTVS